MKLCPVACLLLLPSLVAAQSVCRQTVGTVVERNEAFSVLSLSLPSSSGSLNARAVLPTADRRAGAFVFSLSKLVSSNPDQIVDMMPLAVDLAKKGHPSVIVKRTLTWPAIDASVGRFQAIVLCAQQWLSTHAPVKSDDWTFIGPEADRPTFEQLKAVGGASSMTFQWGFSMAGMNENTNTEDVLRDRSLIARLPDGHE
jgi:hypothetical protein